MAAEYEVQSEIEVLQSIYLDELQVYRGDNGGWEVSLVLYPSTAEDSVSQFVRLTLTLTLDQQYPSSSPIISIHNPRGLSDDKLISVQRSLQAEAESCLGSPVLYQLIEEEEVFTKTSCYHYFHSHCLGRYITHSERELREREKELEEDKTRERSDEQELTVVCPVCREPLTYNVDQLLSSPAPRDPELEGAEIGGDFRQKWFELQKLLEKQKAKGGIIDPEVESNRFLIHINEAPSDAENSNLDTSVSPSQSVSSTPAVSADEICVHQDQMHTGSSHRRGAPGHRRQGQWRGQRRGSRGRPQHGRPGPPTENLDKLSLSSDSTQGHSSEGPSKNKFPGSHGEQKLGHTELSLCKMDGESPTNFTQQEPQVSTDKQPLCQPNLNSLKIERSNEVGETARREGNRSRKRGPHGSFQRPSHWDERHLRGMGQWDEPALNHHWDRHDLRSRGRGSNPLGRGGGARRGHGRGFHQKVVDREVGQEGVL
ncbi:E3 ubiquitin-protein ligase RNF25 isoform X2 [Lampris incognitus]|uniref:E3 ubiquitin-protein ligase RNF25 isoform X2 n=1 Tax=Lampris incognitus TaxID=2546036 RepID=UPI0024B59594|nr:E3 ubiquitin-protein ligase RNF25 isoform X2 [Lampris incognitus]